MYLCTETVTVVHFDREAQTYRCTPISGVSWETTASRSLRDKTADRRTTTSVVIPERQLPAQPIEKGDILCRGIVSAVSRREDLEQYERFAVTDVADNLRGRWLRHLEVSGE